MSAIMAPPLLPPVVAPASYRPLQLILDPTVGITAMDRKATDLLALKHPATKSLGWVEPICFAAVALNHVKALVKISNLAEEYTVPLFYGHMSATWTIADELRTRSFGEAVEDFYRVQITSICRRNPPQRDEVVEVARYFFAEYDRLRAIQEVTGNVPEQLRDRCTTAEVNRGRLEFVTANLHRFPIRLFGVFSDLRGIIRSNCELNKEPLPALVLNFEGVTQAKINDVWQHIFPEEIIAYYCVYARINEKRMRSYLVASFLILVFSLTSENMSSGWYARKFAKICSLFPDLPLQEALQADIFDRYTKLYLRTEVPVEQTFLAFHYSFALVRDFFSENKLKWIIEQIHSNSVRAVLGLAELVSANRFLTYGFLSQHVPEEQFVAVATLVMEVYHDPFSCISEPNRRAQRYLYPDLAYLGISSASHHAIYPCKPLGNSINSQETLDNLMSAIKEIASEIEVTRLQQTPENPANSPSTNPYYEWEQYLCRSMSPKDEAFASLMNTLLSVCRDTSIRSFQDDDQPRKQVIPPHLKQQLELFGVSVPAEYLQPSPDQKLNLREFMCFRSFDYDP